MQWAFSPSVLIVNVRITCEVANGKIFQRHCCSLALSIWRIIALSLMCIYGLNPPTSCVYVFERPTVSYQFHLKYPSPSPAVHQFSAATYVGYIHDNQLTTTLNALILIDTVNVYAIGRFQWGKSFKLAVIASVLPTPMSPKT